jgi:putative membrane protein
MLDLALAIGHHLLIFALFGVLVAQLIGVRRGMDLSTIKSIAAVDLWYGVLAGLILVVGFSRAVFAAKGWLYYEHNAFFWAKMATFLAIGLLSIAPTFRFIAWRRAGVSPPDDAVATLRRYLYAEVVLFALLPVFAAAMARGYAEF